MRLKSLDRLEVTLLLCLITSERGSFRALKMRCVPEKTVFGTEYLFRTVEACFLHRMLPKMRRVPQEAFLSTARIFGTVKACFWYRVLTHTEATCCRIGAWRTF